jgi:hypothetical protein
VRPNETAPEDVEKLIMFPVRVEGLKIVSKVVPVLAIFKVTDELTIAEEVVLSVKALFPKELVPVIVPGVEVYDKLFTVDPVPGYDKVSPKSQNATHDVVVWY